MPRVSDEHLATRREQILEAAWRCFARQGFHATSMQDVFTEAGLSAGAVYRYYTSKTELIRATAESLFSRIDTIFESLETAEELPPPGPTMEILTTRAVELADTGDVDLTRVALAVWAEALRDPEVAEIATIAFPRIRANFAKLSARWRQQGTIAADADDADVAKILYGAMVGFLVQRLLVGDVVPKAYGAALASLTEVTGRDT